LRGRGDPDRWQREAAAVRAPRCSITCRRARRLARRRATTGAHRGLSPRAGLLLVAASRAWALLAGRPMVLPEDVQAVFPRSPAIGSPAARAPAAAGESAAGARCRCPDCAIPGDAFARIGTRRPMAG
jgi:MoxR-like ATPase